MESEQSSQENPDNVNPEEQSASQVRSYDCTFCKRGFSNAQALGGHMNIHRKHKAKLKHPSPNEVPPSPDMPKILDPSFSPIPTSTTHLFMEPKSSQVTTSNNWPWFLDKESDDASSTNKTHVGEIQQLSLFVDKPSSKDHHHQQQQLSSDQVYGSTGKGLSSSELDLELRLGPEPQDSSPATGTKRFF